jgi:hypothetical protein
MKKIIVVGVLIVLAALSRLLPHPDNITPIGSMALLGGALLSRKYLAFIIPFLALYLSDFILNNTLLRGFYPDQTGIIYFSNYMIWTYLSFGLIVLLGMGMLKQLKISRIIGASLIASILFYLISNFGMWLHSPFYAKNFGGLISCYAAALPFFRTSILGDLFFISILFGAYQYLNAKVFHFSWAK